MDGGSVARGACSGAMVGEAARSSQIMNRLEGGVSWPPSSPERSRATGL